MRKFEIAFLLLISLSLTACGAKASSVDEGTSTDVTSVEEKIETKEEDNTGIEKTESENKEEEEKKIDVIASLKNRGNTNPIMTQAFGADPYVLVYEDTAYIYMTADAFEYEADGTTIKENSYSKIQSIHCVSTKDMKNFTDHGEILVAGENGAAKWAKNSWAPAAAHKTIDGKEKFFLYFADNGGGIGVLESDSPTGPFVDPIGKALVSRKVPTCDSVLWLFDPAVLVDDDGTGYIYFGGGVPEGKTDFPGTGRVCKLGDDMISLDGDPVAIDIPYLFEDSGIHKYGNKYYYTYCTNWNVPNEATKEYKFASGEIACMVSDSPMGPFTYQEKILENPGKLCGLYGNNHHALFNMNDTWYIAYHSRMLEKTMGIEKGYRSTFINEVKINEDGTIGVIKQTTEGPSQISYLDPYKETSAVCVSNMGGTNAVKNPLDETSPDLVLGEIDEGDFTEVTKADFGTGAKKLTVSVIVNDGAEGKIHVKVDNENKADIAVISFEGVNKNSLEKITVDLTEQVTEAHNLYFIFEGNGYNVVSWIFE